MESHDRIWILFYSSNLWFLTINLMSSFISQILSLFLAFATRRVKVKGLNDTKAVAGAVYVTSITITVLVVCTFTVVQYINIYAAIFCVSFFIGTTTILALLYIPNVSNIMCWKIWYVYVCDMKIIQTQLNNTFWSPFFSPPTISLRWCLCTETQKGWLSLRPRNKLGWQATRQIVPPLKHWGEGLGSLRALYLMWALFSQSCQRA